METPNNESGRTVDIGSTMIPIVFVVAVLAESDHVARAILVGCAMIAYAIIELKSRSKSTPNQKSESMSEP